MKDLEKRVSIIEEELGINKVNLYVGLKFTAGNDGIVYEITSISGEYLKVGWEGIKDRVDYLVYNANTYFNSGAWKFYEPADKFAELKEAKQSSLEQDIQKLKDKYKQYKFTITIEDNI